MLFWEIVLWVLGGIVVLSAIYFIVITVLESIGQYDDGSSVVLVMIIISAGLLLSAVFFISAYSVHQNRTTTVETYSIEVQVTKLVRTDSDNIKLLFETNDGECWAYISEETYQMVGEGDYVRISVTERTKNEDGSRVRISYKFDKIIEQSKAN